MIQMIQSTWQATAHDLSRRAKYHQKMMKNFRVPWQKEYLTSLQEQHSFLIQTSEWMKIHVLRYMKSSKDAFLPCLAFFILSAQKMS